MTKVDSTDSTTAQNGDGGNWDMVRLSKSKTAVDICSNTIRAYAKQGLKIYSCGKAKFFSRSELRSFIVSRAQ